jgi:serine/threonine-protein kinase
MRQLEGQTLGDYQIIARLGQGAMGTVFKARQLSLNRIVALKVLPPQPEEDSKFVARFKREATAAAALDHDHLVRVYAAGASDDYLYFAMDMSKARRCASDCIAKERCRHARRCPSASRWRRPSITRGVSQASFTAT